MPFSLLKCRERNGFAIVSACLSWISSLLCSSISAVIPSIGLSDYAAANAYLDGFAAAFDDPNGTRVLSVNWDTWGDVGMAVHTELPAALAHLREDRLKHAIASAEAVDVFDRVLFSPVSQVLVSTRDFVRLQRLTSQAIANLRDSRENPTPPTGRHRSQSPGFAG